MNFYRKPVLNLAFLILGASSVLGQDKTGFRYQPVISGQDHLNSKGGRLTEPAAILAQERMNAHKAGTAGEDYFTNPRRRAEIPEMLVRGDFSAEMKNVFYEGWARVDGGIATASGKEPINDGKWGYYFELALTAVVKKTDGRWKVLTHVVAGDISAMIAIPEAFPDVPEALFHRLSPEVTGEVEAQAAKPLERMAFIDSESNFRSGPDTKSSIKFKPAVGTVGSVIERQGNWVRIQLDDGDSGWAHQRNLRSVK